MKNEKNVFGRIRGGAEHFYTVEIEAGKEGEVRIFEHYIQYDESLNNYNSFDEGHEVRVFKAVISKYQWGLVSSFVTFEFNQMLKEQGISENGRFKNGITYVEKLLGKELLVLIWAIENTNDIDEISRAMLGWKGFSREERWWLSTTINAATGNLLQSANIMYTGWRGAIKVALVGHMDKGEEMYPTSERSSIEST